MDLFIIRHGQSEADILNVIEGRADFELTETGKRQAELMAAWMRQNVKSSIRRYWYTSLGH